LGFNLEGRIRKAATGKEGRGWKELLQECKEGGGANRRNRGGEDLGKGRGQKYNAKEVRL